MPPGTLSSGEDLAMVAALAMVSPIDEGRHRSSNPVRTASGGKPPRRKGSAGARTEPAVYDEASGRYKEYLVEAKRWK